MSKEHRYKQLTLNIHLDNSATFTNFYTGNNEMLVFALQEMLAGIGQSFIYCWGVIGVGRSHLLQACCHAVSDEGSAAAYLPLSRFRQLSPEMLHGLEGTSLVCLDDLDAVMGNKKWEMALFDFYNRMHDSNTPLLVSANAPPQQLLCALPDLASRLAWGMVFQVASLTDEQKLLALQLRAKLRGFILTDQVAKFLLYRQTRDFSSLFALLEKLDQASLMEQKKLTIPFLKTVLKKLS